MLQRARIRRRMTEALFLLAPGWALFGCHGAGTIAQTAPIAASDDAAAPPATEALPAPRSTPALVPRNDVPGLSNLAQVSPVLWRGAQPTAEGFKSLKALGIRTIVNLRNVSSDRAALRGLGLRYAHIHFAPWHPEDEDVLEFLKIMADEANHPVFVHCQHGADRTGTMVAIYRAEVQGWPMNQALEELPVFGFHAIWGNLKAYLLELDLKSLAPAIATSRAPRIDTIE